MHTHILQRTTAVVAALAALSGCASVATPAQLASDVDGLTRERLGGVSARVIPAPDTDARQAVAALLGPQPLTEDAAVKVALLNNPGLRVALAELGIGDAERVQAGRLPNPHVALGALREGQIRTINRAIGFDILGVLTLPWRAEWQGQQTELAKLRTAQEVVRVASETRKAWVRAVAAQQMAAYLKEAKAGTEAGAELARRMARVGNWSRQRQAQEQLLLADATAQHARADLAVKTSREQLIRLMGLWGDQTTFSLPERLPDLPAAPLDGLDVEAQAVAKRLDVKSAIDESGYIARSLGYVRVRGVVNALAIGYENNSIHHNGTGEKTTERGPTLDLELPVFDWGSARNARAEAIYQQSLARVQEVAGRARSEAREAYQIYRTAHDLALAQRDEVVPLRQFLVDEATLRYNGMFISVWDLLGEVRRSVLAVSGAIAAQRDFWLAEADLQTALSGTSPAGLQTLGAAPSAAADGPKGH